MRGKKERHFESSFRKQMGELVAIGLATSFFEFYPKTTIVNNQPVLKPNVHCACNAFIYSSMVRTSILQEKTSSIVGFEQTSTPPQVNGHLRGRFKKKLPANSEVA